VRNVGGKKEGGRERHGKLSAEERALFLKVLRETGNRRAAAEAIGVEARLMDQRRRHDPALDRDWEDAALAAHLRLSKAKGPFAGGSGTIRRGKRGRLQLVDAGEKRWSAEVEERFFEALRACGNVRSAARSVGFTESAVWTRRRQWPAFAAAMEAMLEEAELALEFRIASMGNVVDSASVIASGAKRSSSEPVDCRVAGAPRNDGEVEEGAFGAPTPNPSLEREGGEGPLPFDMDGAMRFLKWREEKRRGRGRRAPAAAPPSIEAVTEMIVRRVEAIKRHRARESEQIPPPEGEGRVGVYGVCDSTSDAGTPHPNPLPRGEGA